MERTEVKICGLTNRDDAAAARDSGSDYLGFVLYADSPRGITPFKLAGIVDGLDEPRRIVAVFVNASREFVMQVIADCRLYAVQIHGDEAPDEFDGMPVPVWRAVRLKNGAWTPAPQAWPAERYVADASVAGMYGGTGTTADWERAAGLARSCRIMLAGGLTPENVRAAIRAVRPAGVDTAGGVEIEPGKKDRAKMASFIAAAREDARPPNGRPTACARHAV